MADTPAQQPSIEQRVSALTDSMVKNSEGSWELPEGTEATEMEAFAAMAERRRRDTQAEYSRGQQNLKALQAENDRLVTAWEADALAKMSPDQREELDSLKHEDPDAWRVKLNEYEQANRTAFGERRQAIKDEASKETELERRARLLDEHNQANPELALTDDVIDNDLPPRFMKKLEAGEIDFEQFIADAADYLGRGKVMEPGTPAPKEPNLGRAPGGSKPSDTAVEASVTESYKSELY